MAILPIDNGRYGTEKMRSIFEEDSKIFYQLEIEGVAALSQAELGIIPKKVAKEISKVARSKKIKATRVKQLEKKRDHDTAALVEALAEKCSKEAKPWIHYGLTSNDLVDTSNSLQTRDVLKLIEPKVASLAISLAKLAVKFQDLPAVGRTHGQHASIISFGLKFANWADEMSQHITRIEQIKSRVLICKTMGVVGTGSLMGKKAVEIQKKVAKKLDLYPATVTTQVIARERLAEFIFTLALIGSTLEKIAIEIRNLQRTEIKEVEEPFKKGQMGSSAVPVKRNPIKSERVASLSKLLRAQVGISFENVPLWHERDLSNSANERFTIPTTAIILDEMIESTIRTVSGLQINTKKIEQNLKITKGQIFAEFLLQALIQKGLPRMIAYQNIQRVAFLSLKENSEFIDEVKNDKFISSKLAKSEIEKIFSPSTHLGASQIIIKNTHKQVLKNCKLHK